jgi:hypothetical protein
MQLTNENNPEIFGPDLLPGTMDSLPLQERASSEIYSNILLWITLIACRGKDYS